jgi:hypothetical protein
MTFVLAIRRRLAIWSWTAPYGTPTLYILPEINPSLLKRKHASRILLGATNLQQKGFYFIITLKLRFSSLLESRVASSYGIGQATSNAYTRIVQLVL